MMAAASVVVAATSCEVSETINSIKLTISAINSFSKQVFLHAVHHCTCQLKNPNCSASSTIFLTWSIGLLLFETVTVLQSVKKKSPHFMEPEGSLPRSQQSTACTNHEHQQASTRFPFHFLYDASEYYSPVYV